MHHFIAIGEFNLEPELNNSQIEQGNRYTFIIEVGVGVPLIVAGLVGNITAFCTLGKLMHQNAMAFLLSGLTFVDTCVLLLCLIPLCTIHGDYLGLTAIPKFWPYFATYLTPIKYVFIVARLSKSLDRDSNVGILENKSTPLTISRLWRYCGPSNYRFNILLYWYAPWVFF